MDLPVCHHPQLTPIGYLHVQAIHMMMKSHQFLSYTVVFYINCMDEHAQFTTISALKSNIYMLQKEYTTVLVINVPSKLHQDKSNPVLLGRCQCRTSPR